MNPYRTSPEVAEMENRALKEQVQILERRFQELSGDYQKSLRDKVELTKKLTEIPVSHVAWEYSTVPHRGLNANDTDKLFNKYGKDGWEMVSSTDIHAFFKRQVLLKK